MNSPIQILKSLLFNADILYKFCFKPFLGFDVFAKGIHWNVPPPFTLRLPRSNPQFYLDPNRRLYSNRIATFLDAKGVMKDVVSRLEK